MFSDSTLCISLLILFIGTKVIECDDPYGTRLESFQFGNFQIDRTRGHYLTPDRMRFLKIYQKNRVSVNKEEILNQEYRVEESLENCKQTPDIDCKPLESHIKDYGYKSLGFYGPPGLYVRKATMEFKSTADHHNYPYRINMYPLKENVVLDEIDDILDHFGSEYTFNSRNLGFKINLELAEIRCSGQLLISINKSEGLDEFFDRFLPDDAERAWMLTDSALDNGVLLAFHNFKCHHNVLGPYVSLDSDLHLLYQHEFPYISLRHKVVTKPIESIWRYEARVDQERLSENDDGYKTLIKIISDSSSISELNFNLKQTLQFDSMKVGHEFMTLIGDAFTLVVAGKWDEEAYWKQLLFNLKGENSKAAIICSFNNTAEDDLIDFNIKISKKFLGLSSNQEDDLFSNSIIKDEL